jgi:hypothetical protein
MAHGQSEKQELAALAKLSIMKQPDSTNEHYVTELLAKIEYREGSTPDKPLFSNNPIYSSLEVSRILTAFFVMQESMDAIIPILEGLREDTTEVPDE